MRCGAPGVSRGPAFPGRLRPRTRSFTRSSFSRTSSAGEGNPALISPMKANSREVSVIGCGSMGYRWLGPAIHFRPRRSMRRAGRIAMRGGRRRFVRPGLKVRRPRNRAFSERRTSHSGVRMRPMRRSAGARGGDRGPCPRRKDTRWSRSRRRAGARRKGFSRISSGKPWSRNR